LAFLKVVGKENFSQLMKIVDEGKPALTQQVIAILSSSGEKKAIQLLGNFISYQNSSIKRAAIRALAKIKDSTASRILIEFLADKEEDIRILATENIAYPIDDFLLKPVLNIIQLKSFKKKSRREKQALLNLLARSKNRVAIKKIEEIIIKTSFFSFPRRVENSLCAIKALEQATIDRDTAIEILKKGTRIHHRKIKKTALTALNKLSSSTVNRNLS